MMNMITTIVIIIIIIIMLLSSAHLFSQLCIVAKHQNEYSWFLDLVFGVMVTTQDSYFVLNGVCIHSWKRDLLKMVCHKGQGWRAIPTQ